MNTHELLGEWETGVVYTELGPTRISMSFGADHMLKVLLKYIESPDGAFLSTQGIYELNEGWIVSNALSKGRPVKIRMQREVLILEPPGESTIRLTRTPARGGG
jgi:hypothetical protein